MLTRSCSLAAVSCSRAARLSRVFAMQALSRAAHSSGLLPRTAPQPPLLVQPAAHTHSTAAVCATHQHQQHTRSRLRHRRTLAQHLLAPDQLPYPSRFATYAAARGATQEADARESSPQGGGAVGASASQASALARVQQAGIQIPPYCCGCGVKLQQVDPEGSGYFIVPSKLIELAEETLQGSHKQRFADDEDETMMAGSEDDDALQAEYEEAASGLAHRRRGRARSSLGDSDDEGFPGAGDDDEPLPMPDILCQRCFSLKHSGVVKSQAAEESLPEFDLGKKVGRKIFLQKDRRAVVLIVVDASDFDGSLPREAVRSLLPPGYKPPPPPDPNDRDSRRSQREAEADAAPLKFRLMVALNKVDLLPKEATHTRLIAWVRNRVAAVGLPRPERVFCISAAKSTNVRTVAEDIRSALGLRGDLWVVGAQNVGKSSLIAALKRLAGTSGQREPTVASMPGTTLGLINVPGLPLGPKQRAFDTPGVPHRHQLTTYLPKEDVKQVLPQKPLVPRTYRVPAGSTLLMGGLARLDILEHPGATLYLTVWMSSHITLHMGKTQGAEERLARHVGGMLVPPSSAEVWEELPPMRKRHVVVEGSAWDRSTADVHIAGLGWIAVGVKGVARFVVHTHPDVQVTSRPALLPDYARQFQRPGFSNILPKSSKQQQQLQQQAKKARSKV